MRRKAYSTRLALGFSLVGVLFGLACGPVAQAASTEPVGEQKLDVLQTKTGTYEKVTVTTKGRDYIVVQYAGGLASIKVSDLTLEAKQALGYAPLGPPPPSKAAQTAAAIKAIPQVQEAQKEVQKVWTSQSPEWIARGKAVMASKTLLYAVLGGVVLAYLFFCYCAMLICQKAGKPGGVLVWLPVLQLIALLRAAGMSPWWFVGYLVPAFNLLVHVIWCVKISKARGKGFLTVICLLLAYPLAFMYLAFSAGGAEAAPKSDTPAVGSLTLETF